MPTNLWIHKNLATQLESLYKKRKFDLIPAICKGTEGYCILSMTPEEVTHTLASFSRGIVIDCTGGATAQIINTSIIVDVASIHAL